MQHGHVLHRGAVQRSCRHQTARTIRTRSAMPSNIQVSEKNETHLGSDVDADNAGSGLILRKPDCTRKSQTRLVLLTSIFTRSRASRRRSLPPLRAYSRTKVSLMTRYGLGRIRSWEQRVCSACVRRCNEGLLARLRGAAVFGSQ